MNGGIAPLMLIAATVGVMLGLVPWRLAMIALPAFSGAALAGFNLPVVLPLAMVFSGLWLSMIATAILVYVPVERWRIATVPVSINAGMWLGACAALTSTAGGLAAGLLAVLLAVPVHAIVQREFLILIKVVASWLIAIASLSLFVSLMPTPGYKPDHME